jgi:hypothetical protein
MVKEVQPMRSRSAFFSLCAAALLAAAPAPASAGFTDFIKKVFKVAVGGEAVIKLPGAYPLAPTPIVLRNGELRLSKEHAIATIDLTAGGVPLCTATLTLTFQGVALECTADFKVFKARLAGHLDFDLSNWGLEGDAAFTILGHTISGAHIELGGQGLSAIFTILGISLHVGPVTASDIWSAIKTAALNIINPYELAKKAAKAVAHAASAAAGAVADGAKAVASGAASAAKKVGSFLSDAASSIFGGGVSIMDAVREAQAKAAAKHAAEARERAAQIKAHCEAIAGMIVRDHGLGKAESFAQSFPGRAMLKNIGCDLVARVGALVAKVRDSLAKVQDAVAKTTEIAKGVVALAEVKKRGLVAFYQCAQKKSGECAELWPHLDANLRALAEKYAAMPAPKKRAWRRPSGHAPAASGAAAEGQVVAPPLPATFTLVKALGFRVKPDLQADFVFEKNKYIPAGKSVKVVDILGEPGSAGAFCKVERTGKTGFIRCDGPFFRPAP